MRQTMAASSADAAAAAAAVSPDPGQVGQWGPVVPWPVVAVHAALLPNGKVLAYDSIGDRATETYPVQDHTRATVWDPGTGTQTPVNVTTGFNIFCSGLAHLMDGSIFIAGGNKDQQLHGIPQTHIFDPSTNTWSLGPNMYAGRWYPSVTPLNNGETLITEGGPDMPEVRKTDGALRALNTASLNLPLYPWLDVAPDGRAFYSGPDQTMRSLDTAGGGSWQSLGQRDSDGPRLRQPRDVRHRQDPRRRRRPLAGERPRDQPQRADAAGDDPSPMATGRRQFNLTVLADGTVLATGGNSSGAPLVDLNNGVYTAEQWNPATGQWKTLAPEQVTRQYHSTALLLPDGRVLSAGGGICGTCDSVGYLAKNAQVFSPPYLFKKDGSGELAPRPEITSRPERGRLQRAVLDLDPEPGLDQQGRPGPARSGDPLGQHGAALRAALLHGRRRRAQRDVARGNANIAPPGIYMLFADQLQRRALGVEDGPASPARPPRPLRAAPKIAFSSKRDGNDEIYSMNADGTAQTRLTNHLRLRL